METTNNTGTNAPAAGNGVGVAPVQNFGWALAQLKEGKKVARAGWNAHHSLGLQDPDEHSSNTLPYIYMVVGNDAANLKGKRVPWVCSQTDMLTEDWGIVV